MRAILFIFSFHLLSCALIAQSCGLLNPGMERYKVCPTAPSQTDLTTYHWFNALDNNISTSDYFNENHTCNFGGFIALRGVNVSYAADSFSYNCFNMRYQGCGRMGIFLNYFDGAQDSRYKEFLGNRVDLLNGRNYTLEFDVQRSDRPSTDSLQRDLCIYGYNGSIPVAQLRYNPLGAVPLDTIPRSLFDRNASVRLRSEFTPRANYSYLLVGPVSDDSLSNASGYVYLDQFILTDASGSTLTPIVYYVNSDSRSCCFSGEKQDFKIVGNRAPAGAALLWSQKLGNPSLVGFLTPGDSSSKISGTGAMVPGLYTFYYTFTKGSCSVTDTFDIMIYSRARANAGADMVFCNTGSGSMFATSPNTIDLFNQNYLGWWTAVDNTQDSNEYYLNLHFTAPRDGMACNTNSSPAGFSYTVSQSRYPEPVPNVSSVRQADTGILIWHVIDQCQSYSRDSAKFYLYQLRLQDAFDQICPGDTTLLFTESLSPAYNAGHRDRRNWLYYWSYTADSTINDGRFIGNTRGPEVRFTATTPGNYNLQLMVVDTANTLCDTLTSLATVQVLDTILDIFHLKDTVLCNKNHLVTLMYPTPRSGVNSLLLNYNYPDLTPDSLFMGMDTRGVNFNGIINDVFTDTNGVLWSVNKYELDIRNLRDTMTIVYVVWDECNPLRKRSDTVLIYKDYVSIAGRFPVCPADTVAYLFESLSTGAFHSPFDTSLRWSWSAGVTAGPLTFLPDTISDSLVTAIANNIPGNYVVRLHLTDSDDFGCPLLIDSIAFNILSPAAYTIDTLFKAGNDTSICSSSTSLYTLIMNAEPDVSYINANALQTWWSVLDTNEADGEYVFTNGCVPFDGFDNGRVSVGFTFGCGSTVPYASTAPNAAFSLADFGCYDFVWNMRKSVVCDSIPFVYYYRDTVKVCLGFNEPVVNAGPNDTATCNIFQLSGNVSSASAANDGCFYWKQIESLSGSASSSAFLVDTNSNLCFVAGLDTLPTGTYYFEYTLGCGNCIKKDTMSLYVPPALPKPNIRLDVRSNPIYICEDDTLIFKAIGGSQYNFILNGVSLGGLSPVDTFKNGTWINDTSYVQVIGFDAAQGCYSSADSTILVIRNPLNQATAALDSILFCQGSRIWLTGYSPIIGQRILWYSSQDNFSSPLNGPSGTASGDSIPLSPTIITTYKGVVLDSAGSCIGKDSITVVANPQNLPLPAPKLPADTAICATNTPFEFPITASNSLYPGIWTFTGPAPAFYTDTINPSTIFSSQYGTFVLTRTEENLGCLGADSMKLILYAFPEVDAGTDVIGCIGQPVILMGSSTGSNYAWTPADSLLNPDSLITRSKRLYTNHYFYLKAYSGNGLCQLDDSVFVLLENCPPTINVPDAFTPNGDGTNDFFTIFTYNLKSIEVWIFNRFGEEVYYSNNLNETNDLNKGWNGIFKSSPQSIGVYAYRVYGVDIYNKEYNLKGNLNLIR